MSLFDSPAFENHEAVHFFNDATSGLKAIIAIHSTARGPAAGGCRMFAYPDDQAAIDDALRLSRAMSHKNAVADLDLGGGKAVIIGDPRTVKSGPLFEAFGACVKQLGGRYWSAEDVGVSPSDLAHARRKTKYVAGLEGHPAASGDPSPVTAEGVKRGIELCVRRALGRDLNGISVAIQGVGHVGAHLAEKLAAAGARLTVTDVDEEALAALAERTGARIVAPDEIFDVEADVFAPCAMGGAITRESVGRLKAKVIAGGANNQLGEPDAGALLESRGILYAPDFVINGGGIINVAGEIRALRLGEAFDPAWVAGKLDRLMETLGEVLDRAKAERRTPQEVAVAIAETRIAAARARA
ncbi:MAG TPA: Glu/Leu/Phe/Val dehydrogenase [Caulobacteraceae bacterium]